MTVTALPLFWPASTSGAALMSDRIELEFSRKYDKSHARQYLEKHQDGIWRKLSHHRDEQLARKALHMAGDPGLVLDLP
ncbi:hypothetical protein APX70_00662, partial [Pseudomonas syringae pv. maculicola]